MLCLQEDLGLSEQVKELLPRAWVAMLGPDPGAGNGRWVQPRDRSQLWRRRAAPPPGPAVLSPPHWPHPPTSKTHLPSWVSQTGGPDGDLDQLCVCAPHE